MEKEIDTPRLKLILVDENTIADGSRYVESAHAVLSSPGATQWRYEITLVLFQDTPLGQS
jgi:hypothetical protein